jgi:HEAT repeat protein
LREKAKEYQRRNVQPLIVMAQQPFQLKRPKVLVKANEDAWSRWLDESGWPDAVPGEVLFDPLSTVSASYGVAFQTQFRDDRNVWSSRPAVFVIDADGVLRQMGSHPDQDIREAGIFPAVDDLHEQRQLIIALEAKEDPWGEAARIARAPLGARTKTAIPVLAEALKDESPQVRAGAAAALYWIAAQAGTAVPALTAALQDKDSRVRRLSGLALARIGPDARSAVPALIQVLADEHPLVRAAAISALGRIGPDASAAVVEALQKDKAARIRAAAAAALPAIAGRPVSAVPALIEAMKDADAGVRAAAALALKKIDPQAAKKAAVK